MVTAAEHAHMRDCYRDECAECDRIEAEADEIEVTDEELAELSAIVGLPACRVCGEAAAPPDTVPDRVVRVAEQMPSCYSLALDPAPVCTDCCQRITKDLDAHNGHSDPQTTRPPTSRSRETLN